jgi:hypothetical protein
LIHRIWQTKIPIPGAPRGYQRKPLLADPPIPSITAKVVEMVDQPLLKIIRSLIEDKDNNGGDMVSTG